MIPANVLTAFGLPPDEIQSASWGSGHIHQTYRLTQASKHYILQRFNHQVFPLAEEMGQNFERISRHLQHKKKISGDAVDERSYLQIIQDQEGNPMHKDEEGNYWRLFPFIQDSYAVDNVESPAQAYEGAKAFGLFLTELQDLPPSQITPIIPRFHDLRWRGQQLKEAIQQDQVGRLSTIQTDCREAINQLDTLFPIIDKLEKGVFPLRITHNDTKINNVLFDANSHKGLCVIDWDTVMPGSVLYDIGDMARTFASPVDEDETDLSAIEIREEVVVAMLEGYLEITSGSLIEIEKMHLYEGACWMTLIMAIRFLADYLNGDIYYRIHHPAHNLDRARNQLALLKAFQNRKEIWG